MNFEELYIAINIIKNPFILQQDFENPWPKEYSQSFNPISLRGVSRKHTSYIIDSHVKMSEVNGFFFLDFANWAFPNTSKKSLLKNLSKIFEKIRSEAN